MDLFGIYLGQPWVQADGWRGRLAQSGLEQFLLLFEVRQPVAQGAAIVAFFDRTDDAGDLSPDGVKLLPIRHELLLALGVGAVHLFLKRSNEFTHQLRRQKFLFEPCKDALLDLLSAHGRVIVAGAFAAMCSAAIAALRHDGEPAPAAGTFKQTRKQEFAPMGTVEGIAGIIASDLERELTLTKPHSLPEIVTEKAERGNLDDLPQILRIWARHTLPASRVFDIGAAIPFDPPDIEAVVQDACASVDLSSDRGVAPLASVGAGNAFGVQGLGDRLGGQARGEVAENTSDHQCFGFVHLALTRVSVHQPIAEGLATRNLPGKSSAELATPRLLLQVGQIELGHGAEQSDMHRGHLANIHGM